ncbi:ADP-ribosylglycohydrolase family protein [Parasediminibacterium sp. JCM 36343]|uniref:ADP-ribosylglycohydrolase family protein n=1 Tax=Parasediminibacterium sp. JCM 36343 TaxID=3374279 RepID=UPI00397C1F22
MKKIIPLIACVLLAAPLMAQSIKHIPNTGKGTVVFKLAPSEYTDKVHAIWASQIICQIIGVQFENNERSVKWVDTFPKKLAYAYVDDDWYYEMITIKAFEKYGMHMTVEQLGEQWLKDSCGVWGSSKMAKWAMLKGIKAPMSGYPTHNRLYFTIGPQFSSDVYGALAPGMPNLAGKLARYYCHVNGYAEGVDAAVFVAGLISTAFNETNRTLVVEKAASLIDKSSPYRQCVDMVLGLVKKGESAENIFEQIEQRWRGEYPMPNNAVANGGIIATCLLKGDGDFLKTLNLACTAGDNTDADCNAASAGAAIAAMYGLKSIPQNLLDGLHNRIKGEFMGDTHPLPPVDQSISVLAERTVKVGMGILKDNGVSIKDGVLQVPGNQPIITQPAELFTVSGMLQNWDTSWQIVHSRKGTYVEDGALITFPAIPARGMYLYKNIAVGANDSLVLNVAAENKKYWELRVLVDNDKVLTKLVTSNEEVGKWQTIAIDLSKYKGKNVMLRLFQNVDLTDKLVGNAYWKKIALQ